MARITWGEVGTRRFETGVDRGVLYPTTGPGVPWSGLISVTDSPSGGEAKPFYLDGNKYQNRATPEEFSGTIEAFTYPDAFAQCDGTVVLAAGLFATRQPRRKFGLSYRTQIGNDLVGQSYGYKLHLVYNALAAPTERSNQTEKESTDALTFSWSMTTTPPITPGIRPTAHIVIDSTETDSAILTAVENLLYGSELNTPRLPTQAELITIFTSGSGVVDFTVTDNGDGTATVSGSDDTVSMVDTNTYLLTSPTVTDNGDGTFTITSA